jgi:uncharacterized small protein (DUF1192 family)
MPQEEQLERIQELFLELKQKMDALTTIMESEVVYKTQTIAETTQEIAVLISQIAKANAELAKKVKIENAATPKQLPQLKVATFETQINKTIKAQKAV